METLYAQAASPDSAANQGQIYRESDGCTVAVTYSDNDVSAHEIARRWNSHAGLVEALEYMLECSPCQNGCDPDDMTCASNLARAALQAAQPR